MLHKHKVCVCVCIPCGLICYVIIIMNYPDAFLQNSVLRCSYQYYCSNDIYHKNRTYKQTALFFVAHNHEMKRFDLVLKCYYPATFLSVYYYTFFIVVK